MDTTAASGAHKPPELGDVKVDRQRHDLAVLDFPDLRVILVKATAGRVHVVIAHHGCSIRTLDDQLLQLHLVDRPQEATERADEGLAATSAELSARIGEGDALGEVVLPRAVLSCQPVIEALYDVLGIHGPPIPLWHSRSRRDRRGPPERLGPHRHAVPLPARPGRPGPLAHLTAEIPTANYPPPLGPGTTVNHLPTGAARPCRHAGPAFAPAATARRSGSARCLGCPAFSGQRNWCYFMRRAAGSGTRRGPLAESCRRVPSGDESDCTGARYTVQCPPVLSSLSGKQSGGRARLSARH